MKVGYKQTDIGVIPKDWSIKTYSDIFDFLSTISNPRSDLCFKGDFGYIHYGDIHTKWENTLDLSKNGLPELRRDKVKKLPAIIRDGDLVMADVSEDYKGIAKAVEIKNIGSRKIFSGLHTFLMRDRNSVFSDGIRGYIHEIPIVQQQIQKVATGLKVFGVSKNTLRNILIPIPRPEEQKAIAAALLDMDRLIKSLEQLIAKKRDMKTAVMQQLLTGKKRLPGFDGEWKKVVLEDLANYKNGKAYEKFKVSNGKYFLITLNSIDIQGELKKDHLEIDFFDGSLSKGDLIMILSDVAHGNFLGLTQIIPQSKKYVLNQRVGALKNLRRVSSQFLSYQINYNQNYFKITGQGSSQLNLSKKDILSFKVYLPAMEEQEAIIKVILDMDAEINSLEQRLEKARSLKTGMMQELLTGKTRLIKPKHNQHFEDAVIIAVLAEKFGSKQYPLPRFRYTKFSYLLRRYNQQDTSDYLKKAAGPYNPATRYKAEKIAENKKYINTKNKGFIAGDNIDEAKKYFTKWYSDQDLEWLEKFKYKKNEELELLTTVDMAVQALKIDSSKISVETVKSILKSNKEWKPKLDQPNFSDKKIFRAIQESQQLFKDSKL